MKERRQVIETIPQHDPIPDQNDPSTKDRWDQDDPWTRYSTTRRVSHGEGGGRGMRGRVHEIRAHKQDNTEDSTATATRATAEQKHVDSKPRATELAHIEIGPLKGQARVSSYTSSALSPQTFCF